MSRIIDADTHVIESEAMLWDHFEETASHRRPALARYDDPGGGGPRNAWVISGLMVPKPAGKGGQLLATPPLSEEQRASRDWRTRSLLDVEARLEDANAMGVETQVIYPTLFISHLTDDVAMEVALCRAYNRFMAEVWERGQGRLRWVAVPPLRDMEAAKVEASFSKEHGAVGLMFKGIEKDRGLAEEYFFPIYEQARRLDLSICIHTGPGCPTLTEVFDSRLSFTFPQVRMLPLMAFYDLVYNKVPERFPGLRWGFIESSASWIPFLVYFIQRRLNKTLGPELFQDNRLYVACEADEDIPYLLKFTGEDNMLIGSDYGHHGGQIIGTGPHARTGDPSGELAVFDIIRGRDDVPDSVTDKMFWDNPRRFYGLS